jgi:hypothetical protein
MVYWLWCKSFSNFDVLQGWILRFYKDCASDVVVKFQKISQSLWQNIAIIMWGENLDKRWSLGWNNHKTHFPLGLVRLLIPLLSIGVLNLALKQSYKFCSIATGFKTLNPCVIDDWTLPLRLWFLSKKMVIAMHLPPCCHWHTHVHKSSHIHKNWKLTYKFSRSQKLQVNMLPKLEAKFKKKKALRISSCFVRAK